MDSFRYVFRSSSWNSFQNSARGFHRNLTRYFFFFRNVKKKNTSTKISLGIPIKTHLGITVRIIARFYSGIPPDILWGIPSKFFKNWSSDSFRNIPWAILSDNPTGTNRCFTLLTLHRPRFYRSIQIIVVRKLGIGGTSVLLLFDIYTLPPSRAVFATHSVLALGDNASVTMILIVFYSTCYVCLSVLHGYLERFFQYIFMCTIYLLKTGIRLSKIVAKCLNCLWWTRLWIATCLFPRSNDSWTIVYSSIFF